MQHDPQLETRADLQDALPDRLRPRERLRCEPTRGQDKYR